MKEVSIIILTYNPDWEKLMMTLASALLQKKIDFEIIISDDGSNVNYTDKIELLMKEYNFYDYKFITHHNNVGTVQNLVDAIKMAQGEYIYDISPGDFFYNDDTLFKLYMFCKQKDANICFGDPVYYSSIDLKINRVDLVESARANPCDPYIFENPTDSCFHLLALGNNKNNILGSTYFRKRESALKYIGEFSGVIKYLEDYPSLLYCVAKRERIFFYDDYIIWYEYGTGVSSAKNSQWRKILDDDFRNGCKYLSNKKFRGITINQDLQYLSLSSKNERIKYLMMGHFSLLFRKIFVKIYFNLHKERRTNQRCIRYDMPNKLSGEFKKCK